MGVGLNTILRHLKNSGRSRYWFCTVPACNW
nr:IS1-like element transposase [Shigella sonnei]